MIENNGEHINQTQVCDKLTFTKSSIDLNNEKKLEKEYLGNADLSERALMNKTLDEGFLAYAADNEGL